MHFVVEVPVCLGGQCALLFAQVVDLAIYRLDGGANKALDFVGVEVVTDAAVMFISLLAIECGSGTL
ncbi:hypothetical protein ACL02S_23840 [Nocardia sp. 004]|uniref:hypothetical protein n=1 Tax=Nocardia sp. 004 TaxID=3385978 RepID=UPI0039A23146